MMEYVCFLQFQVFKVFPSYGTKTFNVQNVWEAANIKLDLIFANYWQS